MLLTLIGLGFALVNGTNDGAALVAASLKGSRIPPGAVIAVFAVALGVTPAVIGLAVASTLAGGLVPASPGEQRVVMGLAVVSALAVVAVLNLQGLPTSLTLALVGGLVGAGLGTGNDIDAGLLGLTLAAGVAAPVVGGLVGATLRSPPRMIRERLSRGALRGSSLATLVLQAVAYGANDGQKMYAVLAVGALASTGSPPWWQFVAVPLLFGLGAAVAVRRAARTLGSAGVLHADPRDEVIAEFSSAFAVLGSAAVGIPVSMTQALAGGLIGTGLSRGPRRIRWRAAARLGLAWLLTLPTAALVAAVFAAGVEVMR